MPESQLGKYCHKANLLTTAYEQNSMLSCLKLKGLNRTKKKNLQKKRHIIKEYANYHPLYDVIIWVG